MYKSYNEIFKQDATLLKTYNFIRDKENDIINLFQKEKFSELVFVACGSSYWASMSLCMTFDEIAGVRSYAIKSGDVILNTDYYLKVFKKPLIIVPGRSGSTSETLQAIDILKKHYNASVLSIIGYENAPILEKSDYELELPWITEESICQTRSFSNLYLAGIMMASFLGNNSQILKNLDFYIKNFEEISVNAEKEIKKIVEEFTDYSALHVLGNGRQYGVAVEGAYINTEMALFPSNYYGTLEFRHGPIVMANEKSLVAIISKGTEQNYEQSLINEIKKCGSKVLVITPSNDVQNVDYLFTTSVTSPEVIALFGVFILQGLAYYKALNLGLNPDQPKELSQWINIDLS